MGARRFTVTIDGFHPTYIVVEKMGDVTVASITRPSLTEEETNITQLGYELFSLVDEFECRKVVLDMQEVEYVTSAVVGKMITLHRKLHQTEGRLVLCRLKEGVEHVLNSLRLIEYFETSSDVDDAVALLTE